MELAPEKYDTANGECLDCGILTYDHRPVGTLQWEYFMVDFGLWDEAFNLPKGHAEECLDDRTHAHNCFLCIGCLEQRLGKRLTAADFTDCIVNEEVLEEPEIFSSRLRNRLERR